MKKFAPLLPIIAGIFWGSAGFWVRTATGWGFSPVTILATRVIPGAAIMALIILIYDKKLFRISLKNYIIVACAALMGTLLLNICYNVAINDLPLSLASVLMCLAPFYVVLVSPFLFHERLTPRKVGCLFVAFIGVLLVSGVLESGALGFSVGSDGAGDGVAGAAAVAAIPVFGVIIGTLSGMFYGTYNIMAKVAINNGCHSLTITFYAFLTCAVAVLPFTDWSAVAGTAAEMPGTLAIFTLGHCLVMTITPYLMMSFSMTVMDAGIASILAFTEPVAAMVFGVIIYSEVPSFLMILGLVLVIAALVVISTGQTNTVD